VTGFPDVLRRQRVLPVIVLDDLAAARPLADTLLGAGVRCLEITLRTAAAIPALELLRSDDRLLVGAGSVLDAADADRAAAAGARFLVSPGLHRGTLERARELGLPVLPGVATASELQAARALGFTTVKFFPAGPLGGVAAVRALAGPFPAMRLVPTGGVGPDDVAAYLSEPSVLAVGGSWMVRPELVRARAWAQIGDLARAAVAL
jgi:2-dehydro-3-deoxyphosphogluconate aldolase / (4S)-4-hydroxy-2-oxoglutarate aldolase